MSSKYVICKDKAEMNLSYALTTLSFIQSTVETFPVHLIY